MSFYDQDRPCHSEHVRFSQGRLREESVPPGTDILRYAQNDITGVSR
jgi:hypothetical protein